MVLVDTSVWVLHFRKANQRLIHLLENNEVLTHEFVVGELACGKLKNRKEILSLFHRLPKTLAVSFSELMHFLERKGIAGSGIGFVGAHLLASAQLTHVPIWTLDRSLELISSKLFLKYIPE